MVNLIRHTKWKNKPWWGRCDINSAENGKYIHLISIIVQVFVGLVSSFECLKLFTMLQLQPFGSPCDTMVSMQGYRNGFPYTPKAAKPHSYDPYLSL